MDYEHGSGSSQQSGKEAGSTGNEGDAVAPLISFTDFEKESSGSIGNPGANSESSVNGSILAAPKKLKSSSSGSASSDSSVEEVFKVDPKVISNSSASITDSPKPHEDAKLLLKDDKIDVSSNTSPKSEGHESESTVTTSPISDLTHESSFYLHSMSPTQSPAIQVMERPGGYDPSRIPASVFDSKSPAPNEWSIASNESLFSIHIGNNSFSRDHAFVLGGDLYKSGELTMFGGDLYKSGELTKSGELITLKPSPLAAVGRENDEKIVDVAKNSEATGVADETVNETMKNVPKETAVDQGEEKFPHLEGSWNSSSTHCHSDLSRASAQSFAFPIKKKKSAWPLCHISNCNWAFCSCKWPSCYSWNCRKKLCCSSSCNILTDEETSAPTKGEPAGTSELAKGKSEKLLTQPSASKATPKGICDKWFSCLSCCTCC